MRFESHPAVITAAALTLLATLIFSPSFHRAASAAESTAVADILPTCQGCHGAAEGKPIDAITPILAGQEFYYLYVQLKDYKAGRRENPIMSGMVQNLSKDDMKALATHYSSIEWPRVPSEIDTTKADSGGSALGAGQCSQCHSTYNGDSRVPRLAGQQVNYLIQTMKDFKNKVRLNSPAKGSLMDSFSDEDIESMAHYLANL